jgi:hypothetical protein
MKRQRPYLIVRLGGMAGGAEGAAGEPAAGAAVSGDPAAATPPPASAKAPADVAIRTEPEEATRPAISGWALAELALALVVLWLLIGSIALPRLYRRNRRGSAVSRGWMH